MKRRHVALALLLVALLPLVVAVLDPKGRERIRLHLLVRRLESGDHDDSSRAKDELLAIGRPAIDERYPEIVAKDVFFRVEADPTATLVFLGEKRLPGPEGQEWTLYSSYRRLFARSLNARPDTLSVRSRVSSLPRLVVATREEPSGIGPLFQEQTAYCLEPEDRDEIVEAIERELAAHGLNSGAAHTGR